MNQVEAVRLPPEKIKKIVLEAFRRVSNDVLAERIADAQTRHLIELGWGPMLELWEDIVCPMCYRLNPHHATENDGRGCNWCQDKEDWCGQTLEQALNALKKGD